MHSYFMSFIATLHKIFFLQFWGENGKKKPPANIMAILSSKVVNEVKIILDSELLFP